MIQPSLPQSAGKNSLHRCFKNGKKSKKKKFSREPEGDLKKYRNKQLTMLSAPLPESLPSSPGDSLSPREDTHPLLSLLQNDVFWFQISVDDSVFMEVSKCRC